MSGRRLIAILVGVVGLIILAVVVILFFVVAISSCMTKGWRMADSYYDVEYVVTPKVLEESEMKIPLQFDVIIPPKYLYPKIVLEITPVLVYDSGETKFKTFTLQGNNIMSCNHMINYKEGGSYISPTTKEKMKLV